MRRILAAILVVCGLTTWLGTAAAWWQSVPQVAISSATCTPGTEASNFLARTSGLNAAHTTAYCVLINGLVADGVWTKFDALYVFATADTATALLSLPSSTYNAISNGSPTFTADTGYAGTDLSSSVFIDTGFNPTSASSPNYVRNSAHVALWNNTNGTNASSSIGAQEAAGASATNIYTKFTDNNLYGRINDPVTSTSNAAIGDARGLSVANRSGASAQQLYKDTTDLGITPSTSDPVPNKNIYVLALNVNGTAISSSQQIMFASIGGSLSSANEAALYARIHVYLQTIAGIVY